MDYDRAEIIALNSLSFIAENEQYLAEYLNLSGLSIDRLKKSVSNPDTMPNILASIFDFLLHNEKYLLIFAEQNNIDPKDIQKARYSFPGAVQFS